MSPTIAGVKRREAPDNRTTNGISSKKSRKDNAREKKAKRPPPPQSPSSASGSDSESSFDLSDQDGGGVVPTRDDIYVGPTAQERGEAESDSDPIVESDTTENSGEDDGVSWPSDDEEAVEVAHPKSTGKVRGSVKGNPTTEPIKAEEVTKGAKGVPDGTSSRESHVKQKAVAQERKASKPNAESIARSKKLWERLRRKSHVPLEERKRLIAELFDIIVGHIKDFVFKHDSVRVIQTALKYANVDQRKMIARELKGEYRSLAESRYAKFLIGKLLVHGDAEIRDLIVPELYGHVRRLIKHPEASWILDDIYRGAATPKQKAILLREWYGTEFAILRSKDQSDVSLDLKDILTRQPEKRKPVMHALHDLINQCIQKKTTGFTMLHDAMLQYYINLQPGGSEAIEFMELLKGDEEGDLLKNLAFTKPGARIVCLALAHGNAKDRKVIMKTYKDTVQMLAYDANGYQVILTAYDVVDDTVLVAKSVISELLGKDTSSEDSQTNLLAMVMHLKARIPLLYPFSGKSKSLLSDNDRALLDEIQAIRTTTSKKDPEVRRKELLTSLSPTLLSLIQNRADALVQTTLGCQFISEVILSAVGDRKPSMLAVAGLVDGSAGSKEALRTPAAGRMLKSLVQGGRYSQQTKSIQFSEPALRFHDILYATIKDDVVNWATSGNSFVVVGMLEAGDFSHQDALKKKLKESRLELIQARDGGNKGSQLIMHKLEI